ncbi:MAG TPA: hypothetical protein VHV30_16485 [Polyangiaceae bacterium]|jgi:hypothetical protein|nr:hypothetical protein [Polyangiaceae bacterium]
MSARRRPAWIVAFAAFAALSVGAPGGSRAQIDAAARARSLIAGLDFDEARRVLAAADGNDPRVLLERARLALDELDCDGAAAILARSDVEHADGGDQLADIAHGCQRVTAALTSDRDAARGIEISWQDEHDRPLAPLIFDTVARAREALTRDLGVDWPLPTRIVVVRDLLSLSAMTGLPYASAQTTGTVAVAKWGRVTFLSPRASRHGFPWRDTMAHELTHLAVTRASGDRAPLWLQEGVAKREEIRWRDPGPFDDRPPPESVVARGMEAGLTLPLDKLGPSIAMLPSADAAMVAFAEVTSFVRFYAETAGDVDGKAPLPRLFAELRDGKTPDAALSAASGTDLAGWDAKWRAFLAAKPAAPLPPMFGLGAPKHESSRETERMRDLRDRSRLAQLLLARDHAAGALAELDKIEVTAVPASRVEPEREWERSMGDPSIRWLRGRALEELGRREEAAPLMGDPAQVYSSYGPWWATRGRWARLRGDEPTAVTSFGQAVGADPFDVEAACETLDAPAASVPVAASAPLCAAARAAGVSIYDTE